MVVNAFPSMAKRQTGPVHESIHAPTNKNKKKPVTASCLFPLIFDPERVQLRITPIKFINIPA